MNLIVARGLRNEIGKGNDLLWSLPSDMEFFRNVTMGNVVVMGRKTWESIGRVLPGRLNIVLTRSEVNYARGSTLSKPLFMNLEQFNAFKESYEKDVYGEIFIIGGAEIYSLFAENVDVMYITEVNKTYPEADTFVNISTKDFKVKGRPEAFREKGTTFIITKYERMK